MTRALFPRRGSSVFAAADTHPLVDDFTLRAARHEAKRNPVAQPVMPVESRKGPWSGYPQLGIEVPFASSENNEQTILKLDEWGMPATWNVALGMTHGDVAAGGFDVTARILFGSGGVTQLVEVDWLEGSSIVLPMNAVNVIALYNLQDLDAPPVVPTDLRLRVSLARGDNQNARPTRSYSFIGGTLGDLLPIPPFARNLQVMSITGDGGFYANNALQFLTGTAPSVVIATVPMTQFLSYFEATTPVLGAFAPVPIPPFARYVRTVDAVGAPTSLECILQFGIGV